MWNLKEYHRPDRLDSALELLRRPSVRTVPLAGGTALLAHRDRTVEAVVDLQALGLDYVRSDEEGLHLGAMTRLQALVDSPQVRAWADGLIARAARRSFSSVLRSQATVGGTLIAAGASPLACALLALDAEVALFDGEERRISLAAWYGEGAALEGRILTEVVVPQPAAGMVTASQEVSRTPADSPIVAVFVTLAVSGEMCEKARVAVGGIGPLAVRLRQAEQVLEAQTLSEDLIAQAAEAARREVTPMDDIRASADYRKAMVGVLTARALRDGWEKVG